MTTDLIQEQNTGLPIIVKVMGFSLSLVLVFTLIANVLPQVEGQAPEEKKVDLNALTMETYIAMGEELFSGKGGCTVCHNNMGRAPDILVMDMNATSNERLNDPNYKGDVNKEDAKAIAAYLYESMVAPSKYVVAGFGKKGAEHESPMPVINKPPTDLNDIEMNAIIAFMQTKDGAETTIELPQGVSAPEPKAATIEAPKPAASAEEALVKYTCTACHEILDSPSAVGPKLSDVGTRLSKDKIRESILNPMAEIASGYPPIMPANLADNMMVSELELMVAYLAEQKGEAIAVNSETQSDANQSAENQSNEKQADESQAAEKKAIEQKSVDSSE